MVIESQMPPKYHKILTTFLRTPLHYEVNPQQPTVTFSNREKALAMYDSPHCSLFPEIHALTYMLTTL